MTTDITSYIPAHAAQPVGGRFLELQQEVKVPAPIVLTDDLVITTPTKRQLEAFSTAETVDERLAALLGKDFAKVVALFDDQPYQLWVKFQKDVQEHFFGAGASDVPGKSEGSSK